MDLEPVFMKRLQTISVFLVVFVLASVSSVQSNEPLPTDSLVGIVEPPPPVSLVRTVVGAATNTISVVNAHATEQGEVLLPNDTITTGSNSFVYISLNRSSAVVRLAAETKMVLGNVGSGSGREGPYATELKIKNGSILGEVTKSKTDSRLEIKTPHGVANIGGTNKADFNIDVAQLSDGKFSATFISVTGQVVVSAVVNGAMQTNTLHDGETWTPGLGNPQPVPPGLLQTYTNQIDDMLEHTIRPGFHLRH